MERKPMIIDSKKDILNSSDAVSIKEYFIEHGWIQKKCNHCDFDFLSKSTNETISCGRSDCSSLVFLDRPKRKRFLSANNFISKFEDFYTKLGYEATKPIKIVNTTGSTLFAGTAGQIFDSVIFEEKDFDTKPKFVAQPVIRLQGKPFVGEKPGFSTSFVNIALEQLNPTIEQHIKHIDNWLNFTSKMGLFMGEMTIRIVKDNPEWGNHNLDAITVKMYYGGLEIGVANWFTEIPQSTRKPLFMSDISFGLERMVWVANKSSSYFDAIGPLNYSVKNDQKTMDSYRTTALMCLAGVVPDIKDRSSKLRGFIRDISNPNLEIDTSLLIYYIDWWRRFSNFEVKTENILQIVASERNRNINLESKKALGLPDSIKLDISPLLYITKAIEFGIPFEKVREFLISFDKNK